MILQNLLFPSASLGADQEMYFRTNGSYDEKAQSVSFKKGQTLTLAAYFNCFSISWCKTMVSIFCIHPCVLRMLCSC